MKQLVSLVAVFAILFGIVQNVRAEEKKDAFTIELQTGVRNTYFDGWGGTSFYKGFSVPSSVTVTHNGTGLYAQLWHSFSPNGEEDGADETDRTLGIAVPLGPVCVDLSYSYYDLTGPVGYNAITLAVDLPKFEGVTPFVAVSKMYSTDSSVMPGYFLHKAGVKGSVKISDQPIDLCGYVSGFNGGGASELASILKLDASTTIKTGAVDIIPQAGYKVPLQGKVDPELFLGLDTVYAFGIK
ncbi:MAG: hypothetical protein HGB37_04485 [Candidatus Moranbacteria bacterium]|nr:hypothetical protein [Candidatus Moranbacteria bacterium]NTW90133.1 hypothetical protein [Candidatus Moranbacteria bacterium]